MKQNKHLKTVDNAGPIRNIPKFLRSYLQSKSADHALKNRGNNILAIKLKELV